MTLDQILIFAILAAALVMFLWGIVRYDVVAFGALCAAILAGLVPFGDAFDGFGHPAVITVAMVLVISRALQNSGLIDVLASGLKRFDDRPIFYLTALTALGAVLSGFMNNVGALALLMPIALQSALPPSQILMPLSFGTILGGMTTMIGTPPNIIVASYRETSTGTSFALLDFLPVGGTVALAGLIFVVLIGWRLIPKERLEKRRAEDVFEIGNYVVELNVPEESKTVGMTVREFEELLDRQVTVLGIAGEDLRRLGSYRNARIGANQELLVRADPGFLDEAIATAELELPGPEDERRRFSQRDLDVAEIVVPPGSRLEGRAISTLGLRSRYDVNVLAFARQGRVERMKMGERRLQSGDVLLLQGETENMSEAISVMGFLPLATRGLSVGKIRRAWIPATVFAAALGVTAAGIAPIQIAFAIGALALVLIGIISVRDVYEAIDWPILVLLAAMIPVGGALQSTGGSGLIAAAISGLSGDLGPVVLLALVLIVTMTLSDLMNNAATAVIMAPIAAGIAGQLGVASDPFLMAVAIGASCAFLTPIGHQNNVLVMGPGGYKFGDYWRMGLPLEILVVSVSIPMLLMIWPL